MMLIIIAPDFWLINLLILLLLYLQPQLLSTEFLNRVSVVQQVLPPD